MATPYGAEGATGGCPAAMLNHSNPGLFHELLAIHVGVKNLSGSPFLEGISAKAEI